MHAFIRKADSLVFTLTQNALRLYIARSFLNYYILLSTLSGVFSLRAHKFYILRSKAIVVTSHFTDRVN